MSSIVNCVFSTASGSVSARPSSSFACSARNVVTTLDTDSTEDSCAGVDGCHGSSGYLAKVS
jgi:hypothetical protein